MTVTTDWLCKWDLQKQNRNDTFWYMAIGSPRTKGANGTLEVCCKHVCDFKCSSSHLMGPMWHLSSGGRRNLFKMRLIQLDINIGKIILTSHHTQKITYREITDLNMKAKQWTLKKSRRKHHSYGVSWFRKQHRSANHKRKTDKPDYSRIKNTCSSKITLGNSKATYRVETDTCDQHMGQRTHI